MRLRWTLIKKGRRELWAHKGQYILLIVILGMGIGMYTSMFDFIGSREATMDLVENESYFMDLQISTQYGVLLDKQTAEDILMDSPVRDNIVDVECRMIVDVFIKHKYNDQEKMTKGKMIGYDYSEKNGEIREIKVNRPLFFDGEVTNFSDLKESSCYLEVNFANYYGIDSGYKFDIIKDDKEFEFEVAEIINVPDYFSVITEGTLFPVPDSLGAMVVPIEECYELLDINPSDSKVNDIVLRVNEDADIDFIEEEIIRVFQHESIPVTAVKGEDNPGWNSLVSDLEGDKEFMGMFPVIIFIISGIGLIIALRRMVRSHRPQIGIFKAMGVPNKTILLYFFIIGLIIAICSIIFGYLLSFPLKSTFNTLMDELLLFAVRDYATYPEFYLYSTLIALVLCLYCTLLPASFAVIAKPIDLIQKREGLGKLKSKSKFKNFSILRDFPTPFKMVGRDISRKPIRMFTTIFGIALSLALFLSVVIMFDSFFVFLDETKEINSWDYEVSVSGFTPNSYANYWIDNLFYVDYVNPGLRIPINLTRNDNHVEGLFYGLDDISKSLQLNIDYPYGDGIFISEYISDELNVDVGDFIEIKILRLKEGVSFSTFTTEVEILGIHNNPMGSFIYGDLNLMYRLTNLDDLSNFYLVHTDGTKLPSDVLNQITQTENVIAVTYVEDQNRYIEQMFDLIIGLIFVMILISVVLAVAIVYNLFKIGAIEKSRDYATMKTLGTSMKRISYLIFIEGTVTLIGGVFLGSIGGYYMSHFMLVGNELLEGISMDVVFSWNGFILGIIMLTGVVVMVSFLTIRFIKKINIADVIRDRSSG